MDEPVVGPGQPRLLLAGHSFSFSKQIEQRASRRGAAIRKDPWKTHSVNDAKTSVAALIWADVVYCEWCLGNAVWYSHNKRPGQRLVVRFHRMELDTPYPEAVDLERVDAMVFVARHVLERACERYGWATRDSRFHVVPNSLDTDALHSAKLPGAQFTLGMIGYVPQLKRLDRALDILDFLRLRDKRYRLVIKGRGPWEYAWMSKREDERRFYEDLFRRVERSPNLRGAVSFEPFGHDVPDFLRQVGWILSTSEIEGHSVALAEGMASGAIPVIIDRPGARDQYEARWVHHDADAAADAILAVQEAGDTAAESESACCFAERWSWGGIGPVWDRLLLGET